LWRRKRGKRVQRFWIFFKKRPISSRYIVILSFFHFYFYFFLTFFFSYAPKNPILSLDFLEQKMVKLELSWQFLQAKIKPNLFLLLLNYFRRQE
jgi:hypothetical protein